MIASSFFFSPRGRFAAIAGLFAWLLPYGAAAVPLSDRSTVPHRPRIALVLSGGASRGAAHVGVLKVLEQEHIPIDFICGTSMGAIVGGMYAAGMSPEEMDHHFISTDWNDLFFDRPSRQHLSNRRKQEDTESLFKFELGWADGLAFPASLIAGDKLIFFLRKLTLQAHTTTDFDRLPIPFRAVATDIETGDRVVLAKGDLPLALRASMAIPGVFAPQELDGRLLVDGFLSQNLPVSVAREWGADIIIAVDVGAPPSLRCDLKSMLHFSAQTLTLMSRKNTREQIALLRPTDILIQPELGSIGGLHFDRSAEAMALGAEAAQRQVAALRPYALSAADYRAWQTEQRRQRAAAMTIDTVCVAGASRVSVETIRRRIGIAPGQAVTIDDVRSGLDRIYDLGSFDLVDFNLSEDGGRHDLLILPRERSNGPIHIRAGLNLFSDIDGDSSFNFKTSVTATELNSRGAEWTNRVQFGRTTDLFSEWYQPLDPGRSFFVAPRAEYSQSRVDSSSALSTLYRAKLRRYETGVDAGVQLSNFGELRVGPVWARTHVYELLGVTLPGGLTHVTEAGARVRLLFDQFDDVNFPRSGHYGGLELFSSREELGADVNYNRASASWYQALSFGQNTFVAGADFNGKIGPDLPFYENFNLGGFLNLSGYPFDGLSDQYSGLAKLIYYRKVAGSGSRLLGAIYAGGSLEAGGAWHRVDDIGTQGLIYAGSVFVGMDTVMGPLYLAYGHAEKGNHAFYFYLGRGF